MGQDAKQFLKQIGEAKAYLLKASDALRKHAGEISNHPDLSALPPAVVDELKKYNQGAQSFEELFARVATLLPPTQ